MGRSSLTPLFTIRRRRLIPSLEQVTAREPNGDANEFRDLLSALSTLNEIVDLLNSFRRKLGRSSSK